MSQLDLTKRALAEIGTRTTISSMTDGSPEATYANLLFNPLRDFLLREGDYDWALSVDNTVTLVGPAAYPWVHSYEYPAGALRIRQVIPLVVIANDPRPISWNVVSIGATRFIYTKEEIAVILYTLGVPDDVWDAIFQESFVRLLGSALAFALENRIEASDVKLKEAISFAGIANLRDS